MTCPSPQLVSTPSLRLLLGTCVLLGAGAAQAAVPTLPAPDMLRVMNITRQYVNTAPGWASVSNNTTYVYGELALGTTPLVAAQMDEWGTRAGAHGGSVYARLLYDVMFYNPAGGTLPKLDVTVTAFDALIARGKGLSFSARATSQLSIWGTGAASAFSLDRYNCTAVSDSTQGCGPGIEAGITPFTIQMAQNTVYRVLMRVDTQAIANFDPTLSAEAHTYAQLSSRLGLVGAAPVGGQFVYSAGITSAVPEPQTWAVLLAGLAVVGVRTRKRSRRQG